ncbi:MAG: hypothetical protein Q9M35_07155 [Rhodothermus sp.]|nr:hypothetical protein [Rhodothermus sp.]
MDFWEFVLSFSLAFVLPLAALHLVLSYRREKLKLRQGPSLGARELQQLIQQAVEEAQRPLLARIEALERQLRALPGERESTTHEGSPHPEAS